MILKSFDKKNIYLQEWAVDSPRAVVQIIHGMTEHVGRYDAFAKFLNGRGFFVVADDHRGHGKTDEKNLGYDKRSMFENTLRDEKLITDLYQKKFTGLPYFVLGHSYGSFLTQRYLADYGERVDGVILAGSNYQKGAEVYLGLVVAKLGCVFTERKQAKLIEKLSFGMYQKQVPDGDWLSVDEESNAAYHADPLCGFVCSYRFYADFFQGLLKLYTPEYRKKLRRDLPLLLVAGADDPVGKMGKGMEKLAAFYREEGVKQVELKLFPHSRHEFLNEKEGRDEKWGTVCAFLENTLVAMGEPPQEEAEPEDSGAAEVETEPETANKPEVEAESETTIEPETVMEPEESREAEIVAEQKTEKPDRME